MYGRKSRIKWALTLATAFSALLWLTVPATAQTADGPSRSFGIGLEASRGAGLSVKLRSSAASAWQFGLNAYDYGRYRLYKQGKFYYAYDYGYTAGSFLLHGEYLMTQANLTRKIAFVMPWYAGFGMDLGLGFGAALGVHGSLGLAMAFHGPPIDIFLEWTPRLWLVDFVQLHPVDFNGGVRIWF